MILIRIYGLFLNVGNEVNSPKLWVFIGASEIDSAVCHNRERKEKWKEGKKPELALVVIYLEIIAICSRKYKLLYSRQVLAYIYSIKKKTELSISVTGYLLRVMLLPRTTFCDSDWSC